MGAEGVVEMRGMDFSSWSSVLTTLLGLALFTLIGVGVRLLAMMTIQQRRERANRQINERLKTLIATLWCRCGTLSARRWIWILFLRT